MLILVSWFFVCTEMIQAEVLDPALHLFPSPPLTVSHDTRPPEQLWELTRVERNADNDGVLQVIPIQNAVPPQPIAAPAVNLQWYYCPNAKTSPAVAPTSETTTKPPNSNSESYSTSKLSQQSSTTPMLPTTVTMAPILSSTIEINKETSDEVPLTTSGSTTGDQESMENAETFWPRLRTPGYSFGGIHIPLTFSVSGTYGSANPGLRGVGVIGSSYASVSDDSGIFGVYGKSGLAGSSYGSYGTRIFGGNNGPSWSGWGNGKWGHYGKG